MPWKALHLIAGQIYSNRHVLLAVQVNNRFYKLAIELKEERRRRRNLTDSVYRHIWPSWNISIDESRCFILFIDDYNHMTYSYFLKDKNEAFEFWGKYKQT